MNPFLLRADNLSVRIGHPPNEAVREASFEIRRGEVLGLAGESGSGKSVTALALTGLLPGSANPVCSGTVTLDGETGNLLRMRPSRLRPIRGKRIAYVFQEPSSSFNPVYSIGAHLREILALRKIPRTDRASLIEETLRQVGLEPSPENLEAFPNDFSGGMLQRLAIACALATEPDLLIADEPTTALDTSTQARIVSLLQALNHQRGMSILFISHDLALLKQVAPRMAVMRQGYIVEQGRSSDLLQNPAHTYTQALVSSIPKLRLPGADSRKAIILPCGKADLKG
jgi:ABC-type glutathione transport system ATPase component